MCLRCEPALLFLGDSYILIVGACSSGLANTQTLDITANAGNDGVTVSVKT